MPTVGKAQPELISTNIMAIFYYGVKVYCPGIRNFKPPASTRLVAVSEFRVTTAVSKKCKVWSASLDCDAQLARANVHVITELYKTCNVCSTHNFCPVSNNAVNNS